MGNAVEEFVFDENKTEFHELFSRICSISIFVRNKASKKDMNNTGDYRINSDVDQPVSRAV